MLVVQSKDALSGSTARPTPKPVHQTMPEPFVFVPITKTEASKGRGAAKRIVRAHVTRVQHAKSSTLAGMDLQSWTVKPYIHRDSVTTKRKPKKKNSEAKSSTKVQPEKETKVQKDEDSSSSKEGSVELVLPRLADNAAEDPFWTWPVEYQPNISPIFAHYIQNIAVDIPDIDGPGQKGLLRRELFPLCMTDAATMYAVLLMGASHFCIVNPSKAALIDLLALKARALSEINAGLADPKKATTDAMIMAVAKMAAYESIFGDSNVFAAHMKGLQMMLKLRGGLSTLGLSGLLERMVVWIDLNACHLTGLTVHLGTEELPTVVQFDGPDPFHFAGIQ